MSGLSSAMWSKCSPLLFCSIFLTALILMVQAQQDDDQQQRMLADEYLMQQYDKRSPMKKADVSDFIGSLNGASRLRYGKRSFWDPAPVKWNGYRALIPFRWQMAKRMQPSSYAEALPAGLLDQLNGAERLRFGRK